MTCWLRAGFQLEIARLPQRPVPLWIWRDRQTMTNVTVEGPFVATTLNYRRLTAGVTALGGSV
ncbi:MAG TPA: hypothetical protein VJN64_06450 [Terriglobales bacterium]|nr:hypothetical protein [Terriglobales bacterium]